MSVKYKPCFNPPPKPAATIGERVISMQEIANLGPQQTKQMSVFQDYHKRQVTYHTVSAINQRFTKNSKARQQAYRDQMRGEITAGFPEKKLITEPPLKQKIKLPDSNKVSKANLLKTVVPQSIIVEDESQSDYMRLGSATLLTVQNSKQVIDKDGGDTTTAMSQVQTREGLQSMERQSSGHTGLISQSLSFRPDLRASQFNSRGNLPVANKKASLIIQNKLSKKPQRP